MGLPLTAWETDRETEHGEVVWDLTEPLSQWGRAGTPSPGSSTLSSPGKDLPVGCQCNFIILRIVMMRIIVSWLLGGWEVIAGLGVLSQPCPWRAAGEVRSVLIAAASFTWLHNCSSFLPAPGSEKDPIYHSAAWLSLSTEDQPHCLPIRPTTITYT